MRILSVDVDNVDALFVKLRSGFKTGMSCFSIHDSISRICFISLFNVLADFSTFTLHSYLASRPPVIALFRRAKENSYAKKKQSKIATSDDVDSASPEPSMNNGDENDHPLNIVPLDHEECGSSLALEEHEDNAEVDGKLIDGTERCRNTTTSKVTYTGSCSTQYPGLLDIPTSRDQNVP